jgi:putative ABC transport system permease protein
MPNGHDIKQQIHLPLSRAFAISMRSIKNRIVRSGITVAGVFLAIAFLMSMFSSSLITERMKLKENESGIQSESLVVKTNDASNKAENIKNIWLIVISLVVCGVGITNALLMSVTERFREIGTMKCLGALNRFIVELFILESAFQGLLGAASGMITGFVLTLISLVWKYSWVKVKVAIPVWYLLGQGSLVVIIGTVLAIVAAVYPARRAAKMMPADAMRTEI